ncbi:MAG: maltose alpha-D-glucosyltransferase [Lautropia sp.]|nr:maltose alpha-D-glucosyltransferase [Lautropia sp.]
MPPEGVIAGKDVDPLWYKDAIIYQLHVRAFRDSNGDGIGDFRGLTEKLDYIKDLGVTALWIQPFYPSPLRDDGYDIGDYHGVHPDYGTLADFKHMMREAHRRDLKVITELVINHTSDTHAWFQAARRAPAGSSKRDYYVWSDTDQKWPETRIIFTDTESSNWSWDPIAKAYYWHRFFSHQPDLNFDNPNVLKAVIKVMRFWFDMGVDGMRLDAIPYLKERDGTNNENLPETHQVLKQLRAELDSRYPDRFFLAEANQWPEDVREYFGDGDECHVAYHFPLMPRMYMAIAQEDRHPIVEIMQQTPDIPESCQWAIFLRNHDELTLEMVTSRERDYMYRMYAADPRARINLGIRRRLAPLLENDGDKIKLMNSLLLSMPGSPIIYYGDELGMGDNVYLGDRNGVRTPMQWNPDRNAGFSTADPQRLYLPPVMDAIYGYQGVNVEAQTREPSSLLNWMRRLLAVRKQISSLGRGSLTFLRAGNRKVLAYIREYNDEIVLCVANLSRTAQPVELGLSKYKGYVPVELIGRTPFPPVGELPYLLTLAGHGFYWFKLSLSEEAPAWHKEWLSRDEVPVLVLIDGWRSFIPGADSRRGALGQKALLRLETELVPQFMAGQRWYAGKDAAGTGLAKATSAAEAASAGAAKAGARAQLVHSTEWKLDGGTALLALFQADESQYFVPLSLVWEDVDGDPSRLPGPSVLAKVRQQARVGLLVDAMADDRFCRAVVRAIGASQTLPAADGRIEFRASPEFATLAASMSDKDQVEMAVRFPPAQSSNTTVIVGNKLFLKAYRQLRVGENIEVEIGRFLTEVAAFPHSVPVLGTVDLVRPDGNNVSLAVLQSVVQNQGDGWNNTLDYLDRFLEGCRLSGHPEAEGPSAHGGYLELVRVLGTRTAELHRALATSSGDPVFEPEPITPQDQERWAGQVRAEVNETLDRLQSDRQTLPEATLATVDQLLESRQRMLDSIVTFRAQPVSGSKIRHHGDFHLGQVLLTNNDFVIIDFEGEPARTLESRRRKHSPLRDVAGMIRSFNYAARAALARMPWEGFSDRELLEAAALQWETETVSVFTQAYSAVASHSVLFDEWADVQGLLKLFVLEKTLYELRYELAHRPDWIAIPIGGLRALFPVVPTVEPQGTATR